MATARHCLRRGRVLLAAGFSGALLAGCGGPAPLEPESTAEATQPPPDDGFVDDGFPFPTDPAPPMSEWPECDPTISVATGSNALIVTNPALLGGFSLERVLTQLLVHGGNPSMPPAELLQRLFDTQNTEQDAVFLDNIHCDTADNPAFQNDAAVGCPRAEGALALSPGLLTPGHPDSFVPVALVNRFDLTPQSVETCGEYRIVYAKLSGLTDPNNRLFLIFEGALHNQAFDLLGCRAAASLWGSLDAEKDPTVIKDKLETFFFKGFASYQPLVHPLHFGMHGTGNETYGATHGQVRLSQFMQAPWEMRELRLTVDLGETGMPPVRFTPITVKNNPLPDLFNPAIEEASALSFRGTFLKNDVASLSSPALTGIRMRTQNMYNAGQSAVDGPAQTNYAAIGMSGGDTSFTQGIDAKLDVINANAACPPDDPLDAEAILRRATVLSCAGCHAPQKFLGPDRKIGCGVVWPGTLGEVHIDESGNLSEALTQVFLPRRANVLTTFLQACDMNTIFNNLEPIAKPELPD